jgi:formate-nitrite transporter family protein
MVCADSAGVEARIVSSSEAHRESPHEHREEKKAERHGVPEGELVYRSVRQDGDHALQCTSGELAWSGLAAGISMGFSLAGEGLLRTYLPDAHWAPLVTKFGYALGFLIVVLGRQQLFTEQTLTAILPLLSRDRPWGTFTNVGRLWVVVLATNLLGAAFFALAAARTPIFPADVQAAFTQIGHTAMAHGPLVTTLRGIPAGFLIAMMIWLLPVAGPAKIWIILFLTYFVGLGGFSHIIAGSAEGLYVVFAGERGFGEYVTSFLIPTFVGNSAGGVALVALLAHAQHAPEESR